MALLNILKSYPIHSNVHNIFPHISCEGLVSDCKEKEEKDG